MPIDAAHAFRCAQAQLAVTPQEQAELGDLHAFQENWVLAAKYLLPLDPVNLRQWIVEARGSPVYRQALFQRVARELEGGERFPDWFAMHLEWPQGWPLKATHPVAPPSAGQSGRLRGLSEAEESGRLSPARSWIEEGFQRGASASCASRESSSDPQAEHSGRVDSPAYSLPSLVDIPASPALASPTPSVVEIPNPHPVPSSSALVGKSPSPEPREAGSSNGVKRRRIHRDYGSYAPSAIRSRPFPFREVSASPHDDK